MGNSRKRIHGNFKRIQLGVLNFSLPRVTAGEWRAGGGVCLCEFFFFFRLCKVRSFLSPVIEYPQDIGSFPELHLFNN